MAENIGPLIDTTVTIEATEKLCEFVSNSKELKHLEKRLKGEGVAKVEDLKEVFKCIHGERRSEELRGAELDAALEQMLENGEKFSDAGEQGPYLHELLRGADLNLPENPVIERNPVLAARVEKLRLQQEELSYQAMTKNVSAGKFYKEDTIAYQMDMMNRQLIAVGQVILSVSAGFAFGFFGVPMAIGGMEFGARIFLGLFTGGVIAVAEMYFLTKHMAADDALRGKEEALRAARPHQD